MKRITVASTLGTLLGICFFIIILSGEDCDECFSASVMMGKFFACGLVIFIGSIYFTKLFLKFEKIIFNIETLPLLETNEAASGVPFSCEGTVFAEKNWLLKSPYTNLPCVYFHSITEQQQGSGKNRRWVVIENFANFSPFYVTDARGKLRIDLTNLDSDFSNFKIRENNRSVPDPDNSEIDCTPVLVKSSVDVGTHFLGIPLGTSNLRRSEYILPPGTRVFVSGFLSDKDGEITLHEHAQYPLIVSRKTKEEYIEEFYKGKNLVFMVHLLVAVGFTVSLLSINYFLNFHPVIIINVLIIGNGLCCLSALFTMYNRLVILSHRAQFALNDIDIELKRRSELIPKIVQLAKEFSTYEKELQEFVAKMRVHTVFLNEMPEGKKPNISPLVAILENYPTLKASETFNKLMISLIDTEERIAYARAFYNRNVRKLNTLIRQFPFVIIAALFDMKEMSYVSISPDDAVLPKVTV